MDKTASQLQLYQHLLSFFLPEGILDYFELVWAETQSLDSRESKKDGSWGKASRLVQDRQPMHYT